MFDGLSVSQLNRFIAEAIIEHPTGKATTEASKIVKGKHDQDSRLLKMNPPLWIPIAAS